PEGGITSPQGFVGGVARSGIKQQGDDLLLLAAQTGEPATVATVFTRNMVKAAPVLVCAQHAANGRARAIIANSGCANCCTGEQGLQNATLMCDLAAAKIESKSDEVLVCSTGLIGSQLPMDKIESALNTIELTRGAQINKALARAFMTTDTRPKYFALQTEI